MNAAKLHDDDNGHSTSVQIDPPVQVTASSTTGTPALLPAHHLTYNDDAEDGVEESPLLGAGSGGTGGHHRQPVGDDAEDGTGNSGGGERRRRNESAPFLYRLHDWLEGRGTELKATPLARWGKFLKWILILLAFFLFLDVLGVFSLLH